MKQERTVRQTKEKHESRTCTTTQSTQCFKKNAMIPAKPRTKNLHLQEKYQLERERAGFKLLAHGASADTWQTHAEQAFAQTLKGMKVAYTEAYRKKCAEEEEKQKAADAGKAAAPPREATAARGAGPKAAAPAVPKTVRADAKAHAIASSSQGTANEILKAQILDSRHWRRLWRVPPSQPPPKRRHPTPEPQRRTQPLQPWRSQFSVRGL